MVLDCNNKEQILVEIAGKYTSFLRGSRLYGTNSETSDFDFGFIVPNDTEFIDIEGAFDNEKSDKRIHNAIDVIVDGIAIGAQFVTVDDFMDMIKEHQPFALEAIFIDNQNISKWRDLFVLDKWQLRKTYSSIVNNSWSKAHKKLTVEKDLDPYCGYKSLFHSIRLQDFACQIAEFGYIKDFTSCNHIWNELKEELEIGRDWNYLKDKYKPIYNEMHTKLVNLCPKPKEEYKNYK